ncbi:hypothetical protein COW36_11565 [bacterium (Candidatus Blackallbacteria) CG17_big_fil_post_rev_8_21_14_2_50_48_46]|uniref:Uncharacterized protein n=1 Tax=bacterium (Candidatus Blackallbacteria) CG17_big_fil_post_rev_8_21_14_2_50_48_46 TaxID=2014261 RepID=A0A2M7G4F1_9BACT|nr:MAG: hypothetical protein COW64_21785 [bacterium (Candidatus Blackallbacteria) CG18_big_fil_WC_8_21_14_2_50_49_26]PIW16775.1 MAG: hypothetical protein COW36_11565 [bacterium (Candidatus Blackallbacteria) CG17_big_fil_post_rev_8_21_14_2_50_48_46]PIW49567.1 MAG: hypothetical protein COW20_05485 [bacterium (Candidatus Blackallbacteria) CG13_big_fil_rev_8_21_14_2_50_49_14]
MPAQQGRQRLGGLQPSSWKIRPDRSETSELKPQDRYLSQGPKIRSLDLSLVSLPDKPLAVISHQEVPAQIQFSKNHLLTALNLALGKLSSSEEHAHIHPLAEAAHSIRVASPQALAGAEDKLNQKIQAVLAQPRSQALRERLSSRIETSLARLEDRMGKTDSPRLQRLHEILSQGLERLKAVATGERALPESEKKQAILALTLNQVVGHLCKEGSPQEQATRMQQWALLVEELKQNQPLTAQLMLDAAARLNVEDQTALEQDLASSLALLSGPGQKLPEGLLNAALPETGVEALALIHDMNASELFTFGSAMKALSAEIRGEWLPAASDLNSEITAGLAQLEILSSDAQDLIKKADELALAPLAPKPEPPKGFEEGVLSLVREFKKIIQQLDKDQSALFLKNLAHVLEQRKHDNAFIDQIQADLRFDATLRGQRENLKEQVETRYQHVLEQFQQIAVA